MDPLTESSYNFNPYAYVANDPVRLIDSDGREESVGADGLTTEQWLETSRPDADDDLIRQDRQNNKKKDFESARPRRRENVSAPRAKR